MKLFIGRVRTRQASRQWNLLGGFLIGFIRLLACLVFGSYCSFALALDSYKVIVKADNSAAKTILTEHLDLITQKSLEDLDEEQLAILVEETPAEAKRLLETLGYFNSNVTINVLEDGYEVVATVGTPVVVEEVSVLLQGPILEDGELGARYREAMFSWSLPINSVFTQDKWSDSKTAVLRSLTAKRYPLAKIISSKASVDPKKNTVALEVYVESYQEIRFGGIEVSGSQRYPQAIVTNMADFNFGSVYELNKVLDYQGALEQDGHFANVVVGTLFDQIKDNHVPIKVDLVEVPRQKLDLGLKYDSEEGFGTHFGYNHYNVFKRGYTGSVVTDLGKNEQNVSVSLNIPRAEKGYYHTIAAVFKNSEVQKVKTKSGNISVWRARKHGNIESRVGLEYLTESSHIVDGPDLDKTHALMATFGWTQRRIDSVLHPRNGRLLDLTVSLTPNSLASSTAFARVDTRVAFYYTPENIQLGTWLARAQIGYIQAKNEHKIPTTLMFRTGGASTVRGYEYQSIGIDGPNDSVLGGTSLALASLEYQYPITDSIAVALFHDMGDVQTKFNELKWRQSTGMGVRWFSPVAPLSIDIARAQKDKKWRWHLSLGLVF